MNPIATRVAGPILAAGIVAFALYAQSSREERRAAALEKRLTRIETTLREVDRSAPPPPVFAMSNGGGGIDSRAIDAIAARVGDMMDARAKTEKLAASADAKPAPTREQQASIDAAHKTLDAAITRGTLRRDDVLAMRQQIAASDDAQARDDLRSAIAVAINTNKLTVEDPHFIAP